MRGIQIMDRSRGISQSYRYWWQRGLWTVKEEFSNFSEEDVGFRETTNVCTVDLVAIRFEFISETGGSEVKILFSGETQGESRVTSVSQKNWLVTLLIGSEENAVSLRDLNETSNLNFFNWLQFIILD